MANTRKIPPATCFEDAVPGCQNVKPGFKAPGLRTCVNGAWKCDFEGRFCGSGTGGVGCGGTTVDNEYCGQCGGQPCSYPDQLCTPNQFCATGPSMIDICMDPNNICPSCTQPPCQDLDCWLPADLGSCGAPQ